MKRSTGQRSQPGRIIFNTIPVILALLVFISTRIAIKNPSFIEHYYSEGIYPVIARLVSFVSNLVPFSIWDVFWVIIIVLFLAGIILALFKKIRFGWFCLRTLQSVAVMYSFFYIIWGYNYFRPDIEKRAGWQTQKADESSFISVLDSLIVNTNLNFTSISLADYKPIDNLVEKSYKNQSQALGIIYPNGTRRPKIMIFSSIYGKLGLSGYFGPFFNEIHVNSDVLPMDYPFLLAHEKAHQFGITSEAEANLAAFVVCTGSSDQRLKYSGYLTLLLYFIRDAAHMKDYHEYLSKIDNRVMEDIRYREKYYRSLQNVTLSDLQTVANNSYLKANNIKKGVLNYNQVVSLVISWYNNRHLKDN